MKIRTKGRTIMAELPENPHLIDLFDEDGNKVVFEHLDTVKYKDDEFVICIPYDDDEEEVTEIVIFRIVEDENGEEILSQVFEPDILAPVYELFRERNEEMFEFEE